MSYFLFCVQEKYFMGICVICGKFYGGLKILIFSNWMKLNSRIQFTLKIVSKNNRKNKSKSTLIKSLSH